eukprot:scaffold166812_cov32-Tisochrysis_lutea.AAC.1
MSTTKYHFEQPLVSGGGESTRRLPHANCPSINLVDYSYYLVTSSTPMNKEGRRERASRVGGRGARPSCIHN